MRLKYSLLAISILLGCVLIPYLFWHQTWFGRALNSSELTEYLVDGGNSRKIQHGLTQLVSRIEQGDPTIHQWYEDVTRLTEHPHVQIRGALAWAMGHDPTSELFHHALISMSTDPEPLVRRNVALSLARFGDLAALNELRAMLQPHDIRAPVAGQVRAPPNPGEWVEAGILLLQLVNDEDTHEVSANISGQVLKGSVQDGALVQVGDSLLTLAAHPRHIWESLRALYLIGTTQELSLVDTIASNGRLSQDIRHQARLTAEAIKKRISSSTERPQRAEPGSSSSTHTFEGNFCLIFNSPTPLELPSEGPINLSQENRIISLTV